MLIMALFLLDVKFKVSMVVAYVDRSYQSTHCVFRSVTDLCDVIPLLGNSFVGKILADHRRSEFNFGIAVVEMFHCLAFFFILCESRHLLRGARAVLSAENIRLEVTYEIYLVW